MTADDARFQDLRRAMDHAEAQAIYCVGSVDMEWSVVKEAMAAYNDARRLYEQEQSQT